MPVLSAGGYDKVELRLLEFLKLNLKALMRGVQVTNIFDEKITWTKTVKFNTSKLNFSFLFLVKLDYLLWNTFLNGVVGLGILW